MSNEVILLGANASDLLLINQLQEDGFHVVLVSNDNRLDVIEHGFEYVELDFTDKEGVLKLVTERKFKYVISGCNDSAYLTCAYVAEKLNYPGYDGYETAKIIHHKDLFRNFMRENGFSENAYVILENIEIGHSLEDKVACLSLPLIVKPIDKSGGKGISKVEDVDAVEMAANHAFEYTDASKIIIEEFNKGELKSFSAFIVDQKVIFDFFDSEKLNSGVYQVGSSFAPFILSGHIKNEIIAVVEKIAHSLQLVDGLIHTQFLLDGNRFHIVEITRRTPGDWYAVPVRLLTELNYTLMTINGYMGKLSTHARFISHLNNKYTFRYCPRAYKNGVLMRYRISSILDPYIDCSSQYIKEGEVIANYMYERIGVIIFKFDDEQISNRIMGELAEFIHIDIN